MPSSSGPARGGPLTYATRRACKDGGMVDVLIDTSVLSSPAGQVIGWVNLLRRTREDEAATHRMAERAQVVRGWATWSRT